MRTSITTIPKTRLPYIIPWNALEIELVKVVANHSLPTRSNVTNPKTPLLKSWLSSSKTVSGIMLLVIQDETTTRRDDWKDIYSRTYRKHPFHLRSPRQCTPGSNCHSSVRHSSAYSSPEINVDRWKIN